MQDVNWCQVDVGEETTPTDESGESSRAYYLRGAKRAKDARRRGTSRGRFAWHLRFARKTMSYF